MKRQERFAREERKRHKSKDAGTERLHRAGKRIPEEQESEHKS